MVLTDAHALIPHSLQLDTWCRVPLVSSKKILFPQSGVLPTQRTNERFGAAAASPLPDAPTRLTDTGVYRCETSNGGMVSSAGVPSALLAATGPPPSPVSNVDAVAACHWEGVSATRPSYCSPWYRCAYCAISQVLNGTSMKNQ